MLSAVSRINFNSARSVSKGLPNIPTVNVTSPEPYAYFQESSTLVLQDFPLSTTLKAYFQKQDIDDPSRGSSCPDFREMGIALGSAIRSLHSWGAAARDVAQVSGEETSQEAIRNKLRSNTMPKRIKYRVNYGRLLETIDLFPSIESSRRVFQSVEKKMYAEMIGEASQEVQIIHGDFWTGKYVIKRVFWTHLDVLDTT